MKKQFSVNKAVTTLFSLFLLTMVFAQSSQNKLQSNAEELVNTWYEWPHEGNDGSSVFKPQKYIPVPGIDKQEEPFVKLVFNRDGTCIVTKYCGYCPKLVLNENYCTYAITPSENNTTTLTISFTTSEETMTLKLLSCSSEKLIMNLPPILKAK